MPKTQQELQDMYYAALSAAREADIMVVRAARISAEYNEAYTISIKDAPKDFGMDVFGDGTFKPVSKCKLEP